MCPDSTIYDKKFVITPFLANVSVLYPLKIRENHQRFAVVFKSYKLETLARNGLIERLNL